MNEGKGILPGKGTTTFKITLAEKYYGKSDLVANAKEKLKYSISIFFYKVLRCYKDNQCKVLTEPKLVEGGYSYTVKLLNTRYFIFGVRVYTKWNKDANKQKET